MGLSPITPALAGPHFNDRSNIAMAALTDGFRRIASLAGPKRLGLHSLGVAALIASAACAAEPIDLDVGFGLNGTVYAPNDAPGSNNQDRTVAIFPIDFGDYIVVAETANASGGVSPTFVRVTPTGVQSRNTVNLNVLGVNAACQDPASGGFVLGMHTTSSQGNGIEFRKYSAVGVQDMAFGASDGRFAYGAGRFERVAEMNCFSGRFNAAMWLGITDGDWTGYQIVQGPMSGGTLGFARLISPSGSLTTRTLGSGGKDDGKVVFINELNEDNQPLAVEVLQYATTQLNPQPSIATIAIGQHCPLGSSSTVDKAHVDSLGRVHVAGSSTISATPVASGRKFNWLMQFNVTATGTIAAVRCGTRTFATFSFASIPPVTTNTVEAFEYSGQSIYVLTTLATGNLFLDTSTPQLLRFRDTDLAADLSYLPALITASGNTTPMHRGRKLLLDTRPTITRLLIAGNREFQGTDEDPFVLRMIRAPMFANGFE